MEDLKKIYRSVGLEDPQTLLQSGNVVYRTRSREVEKVALQIEAAIEQTFGFRPAVIQRTLKELRATIAENPFPVDAQPLLDPAKLLVTFLSAEPHPEAGLKLQCAYSGSEQIRLIGRELFIYFPDGMGKSKMPPTLIDKTLKVTGTGRNWNTVTKLLALAESLEA